MFKAINLFDLKQEIHYKNEIFAGFAVAMTMLKHFLLP